MKKERKKNDTKENKGKQRGKLRKEEKEKMG